MPPDASYAKGQFRCGLWFFYACSSVRQGKSTPGDLSGVQELGVHPEDGLPVTAAMGPHGPYVSHNSVNASLPKVTCIAVLLLNMNKV